MSHSRDAAHLAKGYAEPARYLSWYEEKNGRDHLRRLSVHNGLDLWRRELPRGWLAARLGPAPNCLIQGCAVAGNVDMLFRFLREQGIPDPNIHVIDLIDLKGLGRVDERAHYHVADAVDLSGLFGAASVDLLLQDHMMNCAPLAAYDAILGEVARMVRPGGLAMINYTDPSAFPAANGQGLGPWVGVAQTVQMAAIDGLSCADRLIPVEDGFVAVTLPFGNLEYFMPFDAFRGRLQDAGLDLIDLRITEGLDHTAVEGDGLVCRRHHCLLAPCPR